MKTALIIPTCNAARHWTALCQGIHSQTLVPDEIFIIDSSSRDGTAAKARAEGFTVIEIDRHRFSHGGSRQAAAMRAAHADILIYLTQDAVPRDKDGFCNLAAAFREPGIAAAYGRQLPHRGATAIETHARLFNYPAVSSVRSWESRSGLGFKSIFFSNAFGAYRRKALMEIGGFSPDVIFGEDTLAVAHLHRAGWKTAYVAEAVVEHSHAYSPRAEFRRYFDIGVFHQRERWLVEQLGVATGEGRRFVLSELRYLREHAPLEIPSALLRTLTKFFAYHAGRSSGHLSPWLNRRLTSNSAYWRTRPG